MTETKPEYFTYIPPPPPRQIIYPYPPFVVLPDGTWYEMPDVYTLAQMVYDLRNRVHELEKEGKK
jgi:hypothetical protein